VRTFLAALLLTWPAFSQAFPFIESADPAVPFLWRQPDLTAKFAPGAFTLQSKSNSIRISFAHANSNVHIDGAELIPGHTSYFLGRDRAQWKTGALWFNRIVYRDLYPGIDLIFYTKANQLEYDFQIAPYADPTQIDLDFSSARNLHTTPEGDLFFSGSSNLLHQRKPVIYQGKTIVRGKYAVTAKHHLRFQLAAYDRSKPLVIDPVLVYTTTQHGSRTDSGIGTATDTLGNVYLAGTTNSWDFPSTFAGPAAPSGANLLASNDRGKTFTRPAIPKAVLSVTSSTNLLYAGTISGPYKSADAGVTWQAANASLANISAHSVVTDPAFPNRVYAATDHGVFRSDDQALTWQSYSAGLPLQTTTGFPNASLMVNSPRRPGTLYVFSGQGMYRSQDGAQTWTNLRPPINPFGPPPQIIAIDPKTPSTIYIAGAYSNTPQQAFILKSLDSGTTWRVLSNLPVLALTVDPADSNALFAASINGSVYSSSNGGISWNATSLTNITLDALAFDPYTPTNLYAVADQGLYLSTDHGTTWNPTAATPRRDLRNIYFTSTTVFLGSDPGQHAFLTKMNAATGQILWSIVIGGSYFDNSAAVAVDSAGNPFLVGITNSTDFPVTQGALQSNLKGFQAIFLSHFDSTGARLLNSTLLGGSSQDYAAALSLDLTGNVYLAGYATSSDFPTTPLAYQQKHSGPCPTAPPGTPATTNDAFVTKLTPDGNSLVYSTFIGGGCAQAANGIFVDPAGAVYVAGVTSSPDFPTTKGVLQPKYSGSNDAFVSKLSTRGDTLLLSTLIGGANADDAAAVAVDPAGNIYVAGNGDGFPFEPPPPVPPLSCGHAFISNGGVPLVSTGAPYLLKLSPDAASRMVHTTFGDCGIIPQTLLLDASGSPWTGGLALSATLDTKAPLQALGAGAYFLRQFAPDATQPLFSTYLDSFTDLALDAKNAAYVSGTTASLTKLDTSTTPSVIIDAIQKAGTLSIAALAPYSGQVGISGGTLVTLTGRGFSSSSIVTFDGLPATVTSVQPNQLQCIVPWAIAGKARTTLQAATDGAPSNPVIVPVIAASATVLSLINPDGTVNSPDHPALAGSIMTMYASGLGPTNPPGVDGAINVAGSPQYKLGVTVVFNDAAKLTYLGPAPGFYSGISQVNFVVPDIPGESVLSLTAGANSTDFVFVYVQ
jgi:uncharacterized protein (TIGR03437 family)